MRRLLTAVAASSCLALLPAVAAAQTTITFNDGTSGAAIGSFYSALGVTFQNARWDGFVSPNEASVGAGGLKLIDAGGTYEPTSANPIVAIFSNPLTAASIRGLNVGANGARIDAYNAVSGGSLVAFDQAFGIGTGTDNHPLLSVAGANIFRLEFYQPASGTVEGLLFDNLTFTAAAVSTAPEPATFALVAGGLVLVGGIVRRRRT